MSSLDKILGIRTVFKIGSSYAVVLEKKWCMLNKVVVQDKIIQLDRGSKMTVQKYNDYVTDANVTQKVKNAERLKLP